MAACASNRCCREFVTSRHQVRSSVEEIGCGETLAADVAGSPDDDVRAACSALDNFESCPPRWWYQICYVEPQRIPKRHFYNAKLLFSAIGTSKTLLLLSKTVILTSRLLKDAHGTATPKKPKGLPRDPQRTPKDSQRTPRGHPKDPQRTPRTPIFLNFLAFVNNILDVSTFSFIFQHFL